MVRPAVNADRHHADDLAELQRLLEASARSAGDALRETFAPEGHMLSALQLAAYFDRTRGFAFATVTAKGEPRVAPVGAVFYRAKFHIPTAAYSRRVADVRERNSVSLRSILISVRLTCSMTEVPGGGSCAQNVPACICVSMRSACIRGQPIRSRFPRSHAWSELVAREVDR